MTLLELNRLDEALAVSDTMLKINPNSVFALLAKADALSHHKMYDECLELLDRALEIEPNNKFALENKRINTELKRVEDEIYSINKEIDDYR